MARNTEWHYFQGKAKWARLVSPDQKYACWSVVLYMDANSDSYNKLLELKKADNGVDGILNVIKKDEDGYFTTFKRPTQKLIKGKVQAFAPPIVMEADGTTPLLNALVGNGSDVTVKVEVYQYNKPTGGKGRAARLVSVRVDNLIPFEMKKDFDEDQMKQVKGLAEQPEQLF